MSWEWKNGTKWLAFTKVDSRMIEKKYQEVKGNETPSFDTTDLSFNADYGTLYTFNFKAMNQLNNESGTVRQIRRVEPKSDDEIEESEEEEFVVDDDDDDEEEADEGAMEDKELPSKKEPEKPKAASAASGAIWQWFNSGSWVSFNDIDTAMLEGKYADIGPSGEFSTTKLSFNKEHGTVYDFSFKAMTQKNTDSSMVRAIRRTAPKEDPKKEETKEDPKKEETKEDAGPPPKPDFTDPSKVKFITPFSEGEICPYTLLELKMMKLSTAIREKVNWTKKVFDKTLREKWIKESKQSKPFTDYVFSELEYFAKDHCWSEGVQISPVEGVYESFSVEEEIRQGLIKEIDAFKAQIPEDKLDWHPGSNNQVLDLVHPSLFCYVRGVSPLLGMDLLPTDMQAGMEGGDAPKSEETGAEKAPKKAKTSHAAKAETIEQAILKLSDVLRGKPLCNTVADGKPTPEPEQEPPKEKKPWWSGVPDFKSKRFQWLPSEVYVDHDGKAEFQTYINNLHPVKYAGMYKVLTSLFERSIPLFEHTLTTLAYPRPRRISVDPYSWYGEEPDFDDDDDAMDEWYENRVPKQPEVPKFYPPHQPPVFNLKGRHLQVIVKVAEIHLTPDEPKYNGGVWHVEGMENESIVASSIYYYDCDNITTSTLSFRVALGEPEYEQSDDTGMKAIYGLENEGALNQQLGGVLTTQGRFICFPNTHQHHVGPFQLADPFKPGTRRIVVFFLVDPKKRVLSTLHVPPQQRAWRMEECMTIFHKTFPRTILQNTLLPFIDGPMSLAEAQKYREELMKERKYTIDSVNESVYERPFSLCEH